MARASAIWVLVELNPVGTARPVIAFTVKRELVSYLDQFGFFDASMATRNRWFEVWRMQDGSREVAPRKVEWDELRPRGKEVTGK